MKNFSRGFANGASSSREFTFLTNGVARRTFLIRIKMPLLTLLTLLRQVTDLAVGDIAFYARGAYDFYFGLTRNGFLLIFLHESGLTLITEV